MTVVDGGDGGGQSGDCLRGSWRGVDSTRAFTPTRSGVPARADGSRRGVEEQVALVPARFDVGLLEGDEEVEVVDEMVEEGVGLLRGEGIVDGLWLKRARQGSLEDPATSFLCLVVSAFTGS